ncbi:MAG: hypothetical protein VR65_22980 [Desulfobulbaceae bacterium BRH_c16a]|nr:MAG: hypothetical protein VR65_22980 [Desulfobulbaceae bacterium BRH_c16a]
MVISPQRDRPDSQIKEIAKNISSNRVVQILQKNRERVALVGIGIAFLLFVAGGLYLQKKNKLDKEYPIELMPKTVELNLRQKGEPSGQAAETTPATASFFLRPSPSELLQQLASMEHLNENIAGEKVTGLRVLWPVYYYSYQEQGGGKATLLLDVSEDGFGLLIESEVDLSVYPPIHDLQAGQKIWIGGEILAVDPSGTGTIYLKAEHLQFNEEEPFPAGMRPVEK